MTDTTAPPEPPAQPPRSGVLEGVVPAVVPAPSPAPDGGGAAKEQPQPSGLGRVLARAAALTAALTALGSLLGLVRDQTIAHLFGAGPATDAFLVAWTVPELSSTVLIEDAMALLLIPAFSLALARRRGAGQGPDPVRTLLAATLPRLLLALGAAMVLLELGAPVLVGILAPGLKEPALAVDCTRLTAATVLTFGLTGYFSAALRAHRRFVPPAAIYVVYNVGIIATLLLLHARWGVRAAAAGVAVGGLLMVLVQLPSFLRRLPPRGPRPRRSVRAAARAAGDAGTAPLGVALLAPVIIFSLCRQAQVLIERFLAASLPAGAISHLNYAQKVAQLPMVLSLMIVTVTFPVVAQALADGEPDKARRRVERDLTLAGIVVLLGTAFVIACAPQIVQLLFQRGAFDAADTAATASVMRVYALGLLGQSMVGALVRPFFSAARPTWYPAAAMGAGLLITITAGAVTVGYWGIYGIAGANAAGITATAVLLLRGLGAQVIAIRARTVAAGLGRLVVAAAAATTAGWATARLLPGPLLSTTVCCLVVPAIFTAAAAAVRVPEVPHLLATVKRKLPHVR
ncbi:murein biosynthesis integral membrane protein MurJ [Streptomyces sp. SID13666]|uniref:murein biosynthesis integral membrane protein MurJ n=1 Tax=unclassified Streptomyces TaxID=2593676 RepID=UPI0013C1B560|nr:MULTISPECIES: murein biosynthesis integral membrane protein MurJ [unclassified Streptomyces]NEA58500.1 murein biosynthesis integral membrane protein MurJ [Streptomyces sp. SID13666]NEA72512.1 murein biosynthesis integral membrane protein MurJ [Streptomyces sp. SID13588]